MSASTTKPSSFSKFGEATDISKRNRAEGPQGGDCTGAKKVQKNGVFWLNFDAIVLKSEERVADSGVDASPCLCLAKLATNRFY
jgi:hypothetical protein